MAMIASDPDLAAEYDAVGELCLTGGPEALVVSRRNSILQKAVAIWEDLQRSIEQDAALDREYDEREALGYNSYPLNNRG